MYAIVAPRVTSPTLFHICVRNSDYVVRRHYHHTSHIQVTPFTSIKYESSLLIKEVHTDNMADHLQSGVRGQTTDRDVANLKSHGKNGRTEVTWKVEGNWTDTSDYVVQHTGIESYKLSQIDPTPEGYIYALVFKTRDAKGYTFIDEDGSSHKITSQPNKENTRYYNSDRPTIKYIENN